MEMLFTERETGFMRRALELGRNGEGRTSPNPPVGCVIVKNDRIISEGWHDRLGDLHAEAMALREAGEAARGASVFVTLSPCTSHGRQPPCADALIRAGVGEVIVAAPDPNPGNRDGVAMLRAAGIPTREGLLREDAEYLARGFLKMMREHLPYVILKYAMTLDGKIAAASGDSRWVSGEQSREIVQDLRSRCDAVLIGSGTALADDPLLTVRGATLEKRGGRSGHPQPARVVVDSRCRLPIAAAMLSDPEGSGGEVVIACIRDANPVAAEALSRAGATILAFAAAGRIPLRLLLQELGKRGVNMVLCEGGGELAAGLMAEHLVDEVIAFIAPKLIGGNRAPGPLGGRGIERMADAARLVLKNCTPVGEDIMITGILERD